MSFHNFCSLISRGNWGPLRTNREPSTLALESTRMKLHYLPYVSFSSEFKYHAFIIYSRKDELWLTNKILPLLEERNDLKCCIHYRDFEPGQDFHEAMADCVYKSHKVIAVISRNFFASNYCNYELNIAKYRLLNARDDCLIMIRIDDVGREKIPRKLQKKKLY